MVLKLYGGERSQPTLRVALVLKEKNVPFDFIAVDVRNAQHKTAEYLQRQPFGQIPYIDDHGFILYESRAICKYIALKYSNQGTSLVPEMSNLEAVALFEQAISIEQNNFDPLARGMIYAKLNNE
jgi:glutathione S-transferase